MTIGLAVDAKDNVWIVHRPQTLEQKESYLTRKEADCCTAAPDVLEFDPGRQSDASLGRKVRAMAMTGPAPTTASPSDTDGNVWLGANGAGQPGAGAGQRGAVRAPRRRRAARRAADGRRAKAAARCGIYHDSFILKFTPDGKFLGEIGKANGSKGSLDTDNVRGVAQIRFLPETNELVAADGYGNHRVSVWDADDHEVQADVGRLWQAADRRSHPALRRELAAVRQSGALRPAVE